MDPTPESSAAKRTPSFFPWPMWLGGLLVLVVGLFELDPLPVGVMRDDAMYVVLAKSLASGNGYRWINLPGAPLATHFPPGYPALLALVWRLVPSFPANVFAFKVLNVVLLAVVTMATARLAMARFGFSSRAASAIGVAATLSVPMISLGIRVMSEPLFLALSIAALLCAERLCDGDERWHVAVGAGALAGAAMLVRAYAIALVGSLVLTLLLRRRYRAAAAAFGAAMVFVIPWQLFVAAHQGVVPAPMRGNYESYGAWIVAALRAGGPALVVRTIANNTVRTGGVLAATFGSRTPASVRIVVLLSVLGLFALGARPLWKRGRVTALFLAFYALILLTWPYFGARYIWGVWPFVLLLIALGLREVYAWRPSVVPGLVACRIAQAAVATLILIYAVGAWRAARDHVWSTLASMEAAPIRNAVVWINHRAPANGVVAANYEGAVYLYTGRLTVPVNSLTPESIRPRTTEESARAMSEIIHAYPVTTVALSVNWLEDAARALTSSTPPVLVPLEQFDGGEAFAAASR